MPTVSLLSIEVPQGADSKGSLSNSTESSADSEQDFSRLMEQHLNEEQSGSNTSEAAKNSSARNDVARETSNKNKQPDTEVAELDKKQASQEQAAGLEKTAQADENKGDNQSVNQGDSENNLAGNRAAKQEVNDELTESQQLLSLLNSADKLLNKQSIAQKQTAEDAQGDIFTGQTKSVETSITSAAALEKERQTSVANVAKDKVTDVSQKQGNDNIGKAALQTSGAETLTTDKLDQLSAKQLSAEQLAALKPQTEKNSNASDNKTRAGVQNVQALAAGNQVGTEKLLTEKEAAEGHLTEKTATDKAFAKAAVSSGAKATINNETLKNYGLNTAVAADKNNTEQVLTESEQATLLQEQALVKEDENFIAKADQNNNLVAKKQEQSAQDKNIIDDKTSAKNAFSAQTVQSTEIMSALQPEKNQALSPELAAQVTPLTKQIRESLSVADNGKSIESLRQVNTNRATQVLEQAQHNGEQSLSENGSEQEQLLNPQDQETINVNLDKSFAGEMKLASNSGLNNVLNNTVLGTNTGYSGSEAAERSSIASPEQFFDSLSAKAISENNQVQKSQSITAQQTIAIHHKDFNHAVKEKVMLMVNQKLQQVEIRLDPPELGSMQIRVNMQNEQAIVSFNVQNSQAKEALEQNLVKLREMLADSGVDVGDANVSQQQSENNHEGFDQQSESLAQQVNDVNEVQTATLDANLFKASANGIDYYA